MTKVLRQHDNRFRAIYQDISTGIVQNQSKLLVRRVIFEQDLIWFLPPPNTSFTVTFPFAVILLSCNQQFYDVLFTKYS